MHICLVDVGKVHVSCLDDATVNHEKEIGVGRTQLCGNNQLKSHFSKY